jgi:hypothetical protein
MPRDRLVALVAEQARQIEQLRADNAQLQARVERLERLISRNSGNSSMPPSTDDLPGRTSPVDPPPRGQAGKRRRGKQPGAPGAYLAWRKAPDATIAHHPTGRW